MFESTYKNDFSLRELAETDIFILSEIDKEKVVKMNSMVWGNLDFDEEKLLLFYYDGKINKDNASMLLTNRNLYYNIQDKTITASCNCTEKKYHSIQSLISQYLHRNS